MSRTVRVYEKCPLTGRYVVPGGMPRLRRAIATVIAAKLRGRRMPGGCVRPTHSSAQKSDSNLYADPMLIGSIRHPGSVADYDPVD
jgi:hypothetical protein